MTPADLIPRSSPPSVMSLSLYPYFKGNHRKDTVSTQEPTHLGNNPPAPETPRQRFSPEQVRPVEGYSPWDTVNPSSGQIGDGVGIRAAGDRRRVFKPNTRMQSHRISSTAESSGENTEHLLSPAAFDAFDASFFQVSNGKIAGRERAVDAFDGFDG